MKRLAEFKEVYTDILTDSRLQRNEAACAWPLHFQSKSYRTIGRGKQKKYRNMNKEDKTAWIMRKQIPCNRRIYKTDTSLYKKQL